MANPSITSRRRTGLRHERDVREARSTGAVDRLVEGASRLRPGARAPWVGVGLLVLAVVYLVSSSIWVLLILLASLAALVTVAVREVLWLTRCMDRVTVQRRMPPVTGRGLPFVVSWQLVQTDGLPLQGELRDELPACADPPQVSQGFASTNGCMETVLQATGHIDVRGFHPFGRVWLRLHGPLELMELQRAFVHVGPTGIKVLPEQFFSREQLLKDPGADQLMLDKPSRTNRQGPGSEFDTLDDYRDGDDVRRMDWRTTARVQRPIMRRFQIERHRDVMILVDCGRMMGTEVDRGSKLDRAVDGTLLLARTALQGGDRCGIGMFDSQVRAYLPPCAGLPALSHLVDCVYHAKASLQEADFSAMFATLQLRQSKRSFMIVISDVADLETSRILQLSLAKLARRHLVLFAALRTPILDRIIQEPVANMLDAAKKVVVFRLQRERQLALQSLRQSGVSVLDVEPRQLTVPLLNHFLELRDHGGL